MNIHVVSALGSLALLGVTLIQQCKGSSFIDRFKDRYYEDSLYYYDDYYDGSYDYDYDDLLLDTWSDNSYWDKISIETFDDEYDDNDNYRVLQKCMRYPQNSYYCLCHNEGDQIDDLYECNENIASSHVVYDDYMLMGKFNVESTRTITGNGQKFHVFEPVLELPILLLKSVIETLSNKFLNPIYKYIKWQSDDEFKKRMYVFNPLDQVHSYMKSVEQSETKMQNAFTLDFDHKAMLVKYGTGTGFLYNPSHVIYKEQKTNIMKGIFVIY